MSFEIVRKRVESLFPKTLLEEENAIKEVYQEIALSGLARGGFFKTAAFQGGTCLRILYKLNRFSEDLDFCLIKPNKSFSWEPFLVTVREEFATFGIELEVTSPRKEEEAVRHAILKDSSFVRIFNSLPGRNRSHKQKICIKFEVDTNPPCGSEFETHYLDFPFPFSITVQNKSSLFAGKCHALLCRPHLKGRDWYDFLWYVSTKTNINLSYLESALVQTGHYSSPEKLSKEKLISLLEKTVKAIDWKKAAADVEPLLRSVDHEMVRAWNQNIFLTYVDRLSKYLRGPLEKAVVFRIAPGLAPHMETNLFSGAVDKFDEEEIKLIKSSYSFWCELIKDVDVLEDERIYKVLFINLLNPGKDKAVTAKSTFRKIPSTTYRPGIIYDLPGWFIKKVNKRFLPHHGIQKASCWFQQVESLPKNVLEIILKTIVKDF